MLPKIQIKIKKLKKQYLVEIIINFNPSIFDNGIGYFQYLYITIYTTQFYKN